MTEGKPLDAARIALVRDRLGMLLAEQPGALAAYDSGLQIVGPDMWWDADKKAIVNPIMLAFVARFWPNQPLSKTLGAYYETSITVAGIAQRSEERVRWEGISPESKAHLKRLAVQTGRSEASLRRMGKSFDDRKHRDAAQLVRVASAKLRAALKLLAESTRDRLAAAREMLAPEFIDKGAIQGPLLEALRLTKETRLFADSLSERSFGGLDVPQSAGEWRIWETEVGKQLIELGVPKARVVALFKRPTADPEDERTRIRRNLLRDKKKAVAKKAPARRKTRAKRGKVAAKKRTAPHKRR